MELPHNALAEAKAALAEVEAALAASQTANDALQADNAAQGETIASLEAGLAGAQSMAADSMAMADDAQASADMANADLDAMMADAFQPSAVMISDGQIDPSRASFADAHIAIAGPDSVYVSSILYDGQRYSALLRYTGGTTAEVKQIFGGGGKMIPDSVDLSQTDLVFMSPNAWEVSNVSVGGIGYSGTLAYAGNGKLQVTGIRQWNCRITRWRKPRPPWPRSKRRWQLRKPPTPRCKRTNSFSGGGSRRRAVHGCRFDGHG